MVLNLERYLCVSFISNETIIINTTNVYKYIINAYSNYHWLFGVNVLWPETT